MYDVDDLKANRLGNFLPFTFSGGCNNTQGYLNYRLFVSLEA